MKNLNFVRVIQKLFMYSWGSIKLIGPEKTFFSFSHRIHRGSHFPQDPQRQLSFQLTHFIKEHLRHIPSKSAVNSFHGFRFIFYIYLYGPMIKLGPVVVAFLIFDPHKNRFCQGPSKQSLQLNGLDKIA